MNKLNSQKDQLRMAVARLSEALSFAPIEINKDGAIQRFEFTFELVWKLMQSACREQGTEVVSPRESIRVAGRLGLIESVEDWFIFLDARNTSSHIYNKEMANEVYEKIQTFPAEVEKLLEKVG